MIPKASLSWFRPAAPTATLFDGATARIGDFALGSIPSNGFAPDIFPGLGDDSGASRPEITSLVAK